MSNPINSIIRPTSCEVRADIPPMSAWTDGGAPFVATSAVWCIWLGADVWGTVHLFGHNRISARAEVEVEAGVIRWPDGLEPPAWFATAVASAPASAVVEAVTA